MSRSTHRLFTIFLFATIALTSACTSQTTDDDSIQKRKLKVENGLLLGYYIEGYEPDRFTIYERMEEYNVPGVGIAVINNGKIEWTESYGVMNSSNSLPVTGNTMFQAASISKPVAALAALILVERGEIDLDENVNTYLKTWKVPENRHNRNETVTLRRLLNHTSGLTVHGFPGYAGNDSLPSVPEILNGEYPSNTGKVLPEAEPGTIWRYSGGGYTVLQQLLVDVTDLEFAKLMDEFILSKINMSSSTYEQQLSDEYLRNASSGHLYDGSVVLGNWHHYPEQAAAGLWTTPEDLAKFALELQHTLSSDSGILVSPATVEHMLLRGLNNWGLGFAIGGSQRDPFFSHGGANHGFRAQFIAYAYSGRGVIVMTNSDNGGDLIAEIVRAVSDVYNWPDFKQQPINIE